MGSKNLPSDHNPLEYTDTKMPDFSGHKAFILGGAFHVDVVVMMARAGFSKADSIEDSDVVVFVGGADIDPQLYGETPIPGTIFSTGRDKQEITAYAEARKHDKVCFGICRGAQFLHAMNGGKLWQDVNNHAGRNHSIVDIEDDVTLEVTSIHHQMLRVNDKIEIIAVCDNQTATRFAAQGEILRIDTNSDPQPGSEYTEIEIEAGCYPETKSFFVQGHPEIGSREYQSWTMNKLYDFMEGFVDERPTKDDVVQSSLAQWRELGAM